MFEWFYVGAGFFAVISNHRHFCAQRGVPPDIAVNNLRCLHKAMNKRGVFSVNRTGLQLSNQRCLRFQGFCDHHEPAGFFIEPMHDARAGHVAHLRGKVQQGIEYRAVPIARTGVNDLAGRFINHQNFVVLINNV